LSVLRSRDNPQVKRWAKLARESRLRRSEGRALIEGPHLVAALLSQNLQPAVVMATEAAGLAAEIVIPSLRREGARVFLEGVQDAGNVGAIVRSAAAFGAGAVILDRSCADPWSPKALRAGMGGHFSLQVLQVDALGAALESFAGRILCTVAAGGQPLREADLAGRIGWIFGSEARGVSAELRQKAATRITIPLAVGTESLNVAAAAAICLYEASVVSRGATAPSTPASRS
jgi:TrmH family RNA methyltransferase